MIRHSRLAPLVLSLAGVALMPTPSFAHSPVFDCFREGESSIICEGGFSDGASATGVAVRVLDSSEKLLLSGKIDSDGRFSFVKPAGDFHIVFDAGAGHSITVFSNDITS
jgi:hypothetical protein